MIENINRTEKRKQKTREQIISTAISLFLAKGIDDITIEEIAEASDLARATLYNHFANKDELIVSILTPLFTMEEKYLCNLKELGNDLELNDILDLCLYLWKNQQQALKLIYTAKYHQLGTLGLRHTQFIEDICELFTIVDTKSKLRLESDKCALLVYKTFVPILEIISTQQDDYEKIFKDSMRGLLCQGTVL